jgi:tRNA A-37 threonylcarbamoyl transferase component Bud32
MNTRDDTPPPGTPDDDTFDALLREVASAPTAQHGGTVDLLLGRTLGRFQIEARLGAGGMGVVYRARDPQLDREVALKVLVDDAREPTRRARFLREARAAAGLSHPCIAAIHDVGFDDATQTAYIAMELVSGKDLRTLLQAGPLPVRDVEHIALQVARGMARAHDAKVVHRDLKPENVMVTSDGDAKILDFGIAKRLDAPSLGDGATTQTGAVMGTPGYMAPEQLHGLAIDARADVFSFGVMLQELLTGTTPFSGTTPMARALAVTIDPPKPIERDDVPQRLKDVVTRCLQKDAAARFADGRALVEALNDTAPTSSTPLATAAHATHATSTITNAPTVSSAVTPSGVTAVVPVRPRAQQRVAALVVIAVVVAGAALAVTRWPAVHTPPRPREDEALRVLLSDATTTVACVPFMVTGDLQTDALGLAVAASVCSSLGVWRWSADRFDGPAALLALSSDAMPDGAVSASPFASDDAKRKLSAAAAQRGVVVSGNVHFDRRGAVVSLDATPRGGTVVHVERSASNPLDAATAAAEALMARLGVEPTTLPPRDRQMLEVDSGQDYLELLATEHRMKVDVPGACGVLATRWPLEAAVDADDCGHPERGADGMPLWPPNVAARLAPLGDDARTYWQSSWAPESRGPSDDAAHSERAKAQATVLHRARVGLTPITQSLLALQEGELLARAGDNEGARTARDVAIASWSDNCDARLAIALAKASAPSASGDSSGPLNLRLLAAWCPDDPKLAYFASITTTNRDEALRLLELSYVTNNRAAGTAEILGAKYFDLGENERARALASFHLDRNGTGDAAAARRLLAAYDLAVGRPGAAFQRESAVVLAANTLDNSVQRDVFDAQGFADLVGEGTRFADATLTRFVLSTQPHIGEPFPAEMLAVFLVRASPSVAAQALPALRKLVDQGVLLRLPNTDAMLNGHACLLAGDVVGAAHAWSAVVGAGAGGMGFDAVMAERAGMNDVALRADRREVDASTKSVTLAHARLAKQLAAQGDVVHARKLATQFVSAFGAADVKVPMVDDMKALLASLPPAAPP